MYDARAAHWIRPLGTFALLDKALWPEFIDLQNNQIVFTNHTTHYYMEKSCMCMYNNRHVQKYVCLCICLHLSLITH